MSSSETEAWADLETASGNYATRFAGPVGQWFLETQTEGMLSLLPKGKSLKILDVGGGHGQTSDPLRKAGHEVTVHGSHADCEQRLIELYGKDAFPFVVSPPVDLPFEENSFDWVVCFRLLTHTEHHVELVRELCRVARDGVILDYPNTRSLNAIGPLFFRWKKSLEKNTRHWTQFNHRTVAGNFSKANWGVTARYNQFFFPMAFHRLCKNLPLTKFLEKSSRGIGLTKILGNPSIVRAEASNQEDLWEKR